MTIRYAVEPDVVGASGTVYSYVVRAHQNGLEVGTLTFYRGNRVGRHQLEVFNVGRVDVRKELRRQHLATRMYEVAARQACADGIPLASGLDRQPAVEAFWRKQGAKGRARLVGARLGRRKVYVLTCPAPSSLAGRRGW